MDRNLDTMQVVIIIVESLSARRAWIEMGVQHRVGEYQGVALRKESVDRNILPSPTSQTSSRRSPQGERG